MLKVKMLPHISHFRSEESGIKRVCTAYFDILPQMGIDLVDPDSDTFDLRAVHAGMAGANCEVSILHGMYWTSDYHAAAWEYRVNSHIVESLRSAKAITVPSPWVAETIQRDMHREPFVIPHGINWNEWQHNEPDGEYVLWNKNRSKSDVVNPDAVGILGRRFPNVRFLTTFVPDNPTPNIKEMGLVPHAEMKIIVQRSSVYLSTIKETFCLGALEACAAGVPVLAANLGAVPMFVQHGVNGYLYEPGNPDDMFSGLEYCLKYRKILGANGREIAKGYTWEDACARLVEVFQYAAHEDKRPRQVEYLQYLDSDGT